MFNYNSIYFSSQWNLCFQNSINSYIFISFFGILQQLRYFLSRDIECRQLIPFKSDDIMKITMKRHYTGRFEGPLPFQKKLWLGQGRKFCIFESLLFDKFLSIKEILLDGPNANIGGYLGVGGIIRCITRMCVFLWKTLKPILHKIQRLRGWFISTFIQETEHFFLDNKPRN